MMRFRSPDARTSLLWALRELSDLQERSPDDRELPYDNITAVIDPLLDEGDMTRFEGDVLDGEDEIRAMEAVRDADLRLYEICGWGTPIEVIVRRPEFTALTSAAGVALRVLRDGEPFPR